MGGPSERKIDQKDKTIQNGAVKQRAVGSDFVSRSKLPRKSNATEKTKMVKIKQATGSATSLLLEESSS